VYFIVEQYYIIEIVQLKLLFVFNFFKFQPKLPRLLKQKKHVPIQRFERQCKSANNLSEGRGQKLFIMTYMYLYSYRNL